MESFTDIMKHVRSTLANADFFADTANAGANPVPVLVEDDADIMNVVERTMLEIGIGVTVLAPIPLSVASGVPAALFDKCELVVDVIENPLLNPLKDQSGLRLDASKVAQMVVHTLHNKRTESSAWFISKGWSRHEGNTERNKTRVSIIRCIFEFSDGVADAIER